VVAQGQAEYNLPSFYGFTDVKLNFSTDSIAGYGKNVYSDNSDIYLSATLPLSSMGNSQEDERAISDACIDFKLGQFGTKSLTVGGNSSDHKDRIKLTNDKSKTMNGFEMEIKNNCAGDMSAAFFKGTSQTSPPSGETALAKITAKTDWTNQGTDLTVTIDPLVHVRLLERLKIGDKIKDSNGDALYGLGVITGINKASGLITFSTAEVKLAGGLFNGDTAIGDQAVKFDGAAVGSTVPLVKGNALYGAADLAANDAVTDLIANFLQASPIDGTIAIGTTTVPSGAAIATDAIMYIPKGVKKVISDNEKLIISTGTHFITALAVAGTITFEFQNPEGKVENNIDGFRIKFKLSKYGCIGYESFENKDRVSGAVTKNETTSVFLGMDKSSPLDHNSRSYEDLLSKLSVDYLESKRGNKKTKISAIQYKLSDDISLMYGQKKNDLKKKSDIYGMNYKMNAGDSAVLLKIRGQSEAADVDHNRLQIQMELPTNLIDYTQE